MLWRYSTISQSSASMSVWEASQPIRMQLSAVFIKMQGRTSAPPPFSVRAHSLAFFDQKFSKAILRGSVVLPDSELRRRHLRESARHDRGAQAASVLPPPLAGIA